MFGRKMLKIEAGDSSKILVHFYKFFEGNCWRYKQEILSKFWYIATNVSKENAEGEGRRFFQSSGTLLQMLRRKMLKVQAGDSSKILVHSNQSFKEKFWICREQILPKFWYIATKVSKESAGDKGSKFFQNSGTHVTHCVTSFP